MEYTEKHIKMVMELNKFQDVYKSPFELTKQGSIEISKLANGDGWFEMENKQELLDFLESRYKPNIEGERRLALEKKFSTANINDIEPYFVRFHP